jgi:hypothetical protein
VIVQPGRLDAQSFAIGCLLTKIWLLSRSNEDGVLDSFEGVGVNPDVQNRGVSSGDLSGSPFMFPLGLPPPRASPIALKSYLTWIGLHYFRPN